MEFCRQGRTAAVPDTREYPAGANGRGKLGVTHSHP